MSNNLKQSFSENHQVSLFTDYLLSLLDGRRGFSHTWKARSGKNKTGFKKGFLWRCDSLTDAYEQYRWPALSPTGNLTFTLEESNRILNYHEASIVKTLEKADTSQDDIHLLKEDILGVLRWGGVDTKPNIAKAMRADSAQLKVNLNNAVELINHGGSMSEAEFDARYEQLDENHIRIDSGTTKIYSLICRDFIILDSRVGAALGLLVKNFCHDHDIPTETVCNDLRFSWGAASGEKRTYKIRNPNSTSSAVFQNFGRLTNKERLLQNLKASWLLSDVISKTKIPSFSSAHTAGGLRRLEAALFMIGYDVNYVNRQKQLDRNRRHHVRDIMPSAAMAFAPD
ncbi:hypothetical protein [Halioxenophilus aromaticivorans]|uniref:Uncharacterized protein n=1 Tax=Halioxenophilus aromaticivorans TaxID=1306992 RepID=A0AAV3TXX0_9ALTE